MYDFILFQHSDGRSPNFYCLYKHPITGKQCHFSCRATDRGEAFQYATRELPRLIRKAYEKDRDPQQNRQGLRGSTARTRSKLQQALTPITIKEFAAKYVSQHRTKRGRPLKDKSQKAILDTFNQFDKYIRRSLDLKQDQSPYLHAVTMEMCKAFILEEQPSDRTAQKHCISLCAAFRAAVADGYIGSNFFERITPPVPEYTDEQIDARCFTDEKFAIFLKEIPTQTFAQRRLRNMLLLDHETGLRLGELRHIKKEWLDLSKNVLQVRSDKDFSPKTRSSSRKIPLSHLAVAVVNSQLRENAQHHNDLIRSSDYLFPNEMGRPLSEGGIENPFRELRKQVFGDQYRPTIHGLRHAFVTRLTAAGLSDRIVQGVSGHETRAMIDRYSHIESQAIEPVRQALDNTLLDAAEVREQAARVE